MNSIYPIFYARHPEMRRLGAPGTSGACGIILYGERLTFEWHYYYPVRKFYVQTYLFYKRA